MIQGDRYNLLEEDIIITPANSLAVIKWPDKSETRIGSSSRLKIDRMKVARDYSSIEIEFSLEDWQIWSTVVRTIYPGSYFRTKLPDQWVIAGVRWTVYDIDISRWYIRSIDHSVILSDSQWNTMSLLPGELVSIQNIFKKLGKEVVDQAWNTMNQARDVLFLNEHGANLQKQINILSGQSSNYWDRFVRWILSFIPKFDELSILESLVLKKWSLNDLDISKEHILSIYQKLQDTKFVQERDSLRSYLESKWTSIWMSSDQFQVFTRGALWDAITFSGITLQWADSMVKDYTKTLDAQIQSVMRVVPVGELDSKARETLRQLIK